MTDETTTGPDTTAPAEPAADGRDDAAAYTRVVHPATEHKTVPAVLAAICEAMNAIEAIGKGKTSDHGNFKFRGVDDVMNALAPIMRAHCLFVSPHLVSIERMRLDTKNGGGLMNTVVQVEYTFTSGADGSKHVVGPIPGEGMDTGDKSTAKAMSVAFRTMLLQVFMIPTEDRDPDHDVYEVAGGDAPAAPVPRQPAPKVHGRRQRADDVDPWADDNPERVTYYRGAIEASGSNDSLRLVWDDIKAECEAGKLSEKDGKHLYNLTTRRIETLKHEEAKAAAADPEAEFHTA